ncbi:MAG: hydroxysqualene dehydroxylase HpnE [Leptospirales bacterium]
MADPRPALYIVGGGLSGIAAAESLSHGTGRPRKVVLLEARPHLGGRTGSYRESFDGQTHDTGQHLFMDGYVATRRLLRSLGTEDRLTFLDPFSLYLMDRKNRLSLFELPLHSGKLGLFTGIMGFSGLSLRSRLSLLRIRGALPERDTQVDHLDARSFLEQSGQTPEAIDKFWELLTVSATNLPTHRVSAALLVSILKESLFSGDGPRTLGYNTVPLSELIGTPAQKLLSERGVEMRFQSGVSRLKIEKDHIAGFMAGKETVSLGPEDHVLLAVPPWSFEALFPVEWMNQPLVQNVVRLSEASPILSVHLWFDRPVAVPLISGFSESALHWIFNKDLMMGRAGPGIPPDPGLFDFNYSSFNYASPSHLFHPATMLSCVVSGAADLLVHGDDEIVGIALDTVSRLNGAGSRKNLIHARVIRDRFATPVLAPGQGLCRPEARSFLANLWIAGDMADTGLPATMEGAVRAGFQAAQEIERQLERRRTER